MVCERRSVLCCAGVTVQGNLFCLPWALETIDLKITSLNTHALAMNMAMTSGSQFQAKNAYATVVSGPGQPPRVAARRSNEHQFSWRLPGCCGMSNVDVRGIPL